MTSDASMQTGFNEINALPLEQTWPQLDSMETNPGLQPCRGHVEVACRGQASGAFGEKRAVEVFSWPKTPGMSLPRSLQKTEPTPAQQPALRWPWVLPHAACSSPLASADSESASEENVHFAFHCPKLMQGDTG